MRNCLAFATQSLPSFLIQMGIWNILDVFNTFQVITDVLTLDQSLVKTTVPEEMKFGATLNDQGYWTNRSANFLLQHLVKLISNPGSPEEAVKINTALKTLCIKQNGSSYKFYEMVLEGTHQRMLFQKLSQICGPLEDEIKINTELIIMLINSHLLTLQHFQELSTFQDCATKIAHYLIHNVNRLHRLNAFLYIIQNWCRDNNLIQLLEEVVFDVEMIQSVNIQQNIEDDMKKTLCEMY